jgi:carboxymethylenebutenolidase
MTSKRAFAVVSAVAVLAACHRAAATDDHAGHMSVDLAAPAGTFAAAQSDASLPASNSNAKARLTSSNRHGEWVKVAWEPGSSDSLMAWMVFPSTSNAKTPVVVVVHENIGLTTWVRGVADQVAADGFIAIAPDLISRARGGPSTEELAPDSVRRIIQSVPMADRVRGVAAVARYAMSHTSAAPRYAVIGYCWGGSTVWSHAINGGIAGFSGGVAFYGTPYMTSGAPNADSLAKISKPVMLLNGSKDARIGAAMPAIDSIMKAMRKSYVGVNYQGAVHGFLRAQNDPRAQNRDEAEEQANLAATKDGWPRTIAFLRKNLAM